MSEQEVDAAEAIKKQTREVVKIARKFKFHEVAPLVTKLKTLIEDADKLPGANPYIDPEEYEYPFDLQSAYLKGTKTQKVHAKIEADAPAHACGCDPVKCQCSSTEETVSQLKGLRCAYCEEEILVGNPLHISVITGTKMCEVCARILAEKVRFKESVAYAVINLIEDACSESAPPYFQSKAALKLVEEAQERLEAFRMAQRTKVAR